MVGLDKQNKLQAIFSVACDCFRLMLVRHLDCVNLLMGTGFVAPQGLQRSLFQIEYLA